MSNYNSQLQSNNTDLQQVLQTLQSKATQATPVISIDPLTGYITARAGDRFSTFKLPFQNARTITPTTTSQIAVPSNYYTGGSVTVKGDSNLVAENIKSGVTIFDVKGTYVGSGNVDREDQLIMGTISSYTNDRVSTIRANLFNGCSKLTTVSFPAATAIGSSAFQGCSRLTSVDFSAVTFIYEYAFANCYSLTTTSFPNVKTLRGSAFQSCSSLTSVNFPTASIIGACAFSSCINLTTVNFPAATEIGSSAFTRCSSLTSVNFPAVKEIGSRAFYGCSNLITVNFPATTEIGSSAFYDCDNLTTVSFPIASSIGSGAFCYCATLATVSFPAATSIGNSAFYRCYNLKSLYLTGSSLCKLVNSAAFSSTPIGGYSTTAGTYGKIYVPTSLLASYKTAYAWSYLSSRFVGI